MTMDILHPIVFSDNEIHGLISLLEKREQTTILFHREMSGVWFYDENREMELRILLLADIRLTISRVCFIHRHQGTMTEVFHWLVEFCKVHHIKEICVQSVESKEMANWCIKNNFVPDPNSTFPMDNFICGDYKIQL